MEVGEKGVDGFEFKSWIDKDVVFALGLSGFGPEFESAGDGGADGDDAVLGSFGGMDGGESFFWDVKVFGVHVVFFDLVAANGKEGAEADVEGEVDDFDTFLLETGEKVGGHVEAGGGGGSGAELARPDGLITGGIFGGGSAAEVGWQRDGAVSFDDLGEGAGACYESGAVSEKLFDNDFIGGCF